MTDWHTNTSKEPGTWGAFMAYAIAIGIDIEVTPDVMYPDGTMGPVPHLYRILEGEVLTYPMPRNCYPSRPLFQWKLTEVCRQLRIPEPPDWPPGPPGTPERSPKSSGGSE